MASERYSQPSNPRSPKAILVTTLLAHLQPLSTAQPSLKNHHFPQPQLHYHTPVPLHTPFLLLEKCPEDPALSLPSPTRQNSAMLMLTKMHHQEKKSRWTQHDIIKKGVATYTFSHGQLLTWFSGEENWEARGRRGNLLSLCLFVPLELCEYLTYSKLIELKFRKRQNKFRKLNRKINITGPSGLSLEHPCPGWATAPSSSRVSREGRVLGWAQLWVVAADQGWAQGESGREQTCQPLENLLKPPTEAPMSQGPHARSRGKLEAEVKALPRAESLGETEEHLVGDPAQGQ